MVKRSKGMNLDAEIKLLRFLSKHSSTQIPQETIHQYGDNLADVESLLEDGLISRERVFSVGTMKMYYRITPSGYRFIQEENTRRNTKVIIVITLLTLIASVIGLIFKMI
jgi:hypothetical protein